VHAPAIFDFGKLVLCHVFCATNSCNDDDPRRIFEAVCPPSATLGLGSGLALVWERVDDG